MKGMHRRHSRHGEGQERQSPGRRLGVALALLALSAHLVLPLFYTCRTYRTLFLGPVPACCAGKAGSASSPACRSDAATLAASPGQGRGCPYCKAASPFRHADFSPMASAPGGSAPLWAIAVETPNSLPAFPPDLTSASPRAPPVLS